MAYEQQLEAGRLEHEHDHMSATVAPRTFGIQHKKSEEFITFRFICFYWPISIKVSESGLKMFFGGGFFLSVIRARRLDISWAVHCH